VFPKHRHVVSILEFDKNTAPHRMMIIFIFIRALTPYFLLHNGTFMGGALSFFGFSETDYVPF
jgi:hypothetical protein